MGKRLADLGQYHDAFPHLLKAMPETRTFDYDEPQRLASSRTFGPCSRRILSKRDQAGGDKSWSPIFIVACRAPDHLMESAGEPFEGFRRANWRVKDAIGGVRQRSGDRAAYPRCPKPCQGIRSARSARFYTAGPRPRARRPSAIVERCHSTSSLSAIHLRCRTPASSMRVAIPSNCLSCFSCCSRKASRCLRSRRTRPLLSRLRSGHEHWHKVRRRRHDRCTLRGFVDDLEGSARRVLKHCDLEWEDAARFPQTPNGRCGTASLMQVRKPVYRDSIGAWRRYAEHL